MEKIQASLRALRELFFQQEVQRGRGTEAQSELPKAGKLFSLLNRHGENTSFSAGFA